MFCSILQNLKLRRIVANRESELKIRHRERDDDGRSLVVKVLKSVERQDQCVVCKGITSFDTSSKLRTLTGVKYLPTLN
eukprot:scaffold79313_cov55-Attheya_sp.AAC.3